jgi:hypothetical protein
MNARSAGRDRKSEGPLALLALSVVRPHHHVWGVLLGPVRPTAASLWASGKTIVRRFTEPRSRMVSRRLLGCRIFGTPQNETVRCVQANLCSRVQNQSDGWLRREWSRRVRDPEAMSLWRAAHSQTLGLDQRRRDDLRRAGGNDQRVAAAIPLPIKVECLLVNCRQSLGGLIPASPIA